MSSALSSQHGKIAIVGGGSIGVAFAVVFARAGHAVGLFDPDAERRAAVPGEFAQRVRGLAAFGLLDEPADVLLRRLSIDDTLSDAVAGAMLVQECAPERLDLKASLFAELDRLAASDAVLASASSALPASAFAAALPGAHRCLIAHPGNPPYLIPVIELVPASFTDAATVARADAIYRGAGLSPVHVRREIEGFVFNRLQGALLREAYCLVRDGVASVDDIDTVVRDGLGLRWSVIGPFETVDLNTRGGIASHAEKLGPAYARMGAERGQHDPWTPELVAEVNAQRRQAVPLDQWQARVDWRDRELMALVRERRRRQPDDA
ncbi:3-hydroxyacyl-CoA dehydrogenase [Chitinasiproducens palmae]|uniref:3-hydroxyacyl-CoA dehydrogenase n=1 Tax=Chitinasiproducens palmae TaxID=1770053 RepID=A0A1H2PJD1_9BURK|nr:3-hydroxyacyl-CoA dehydrogenase [Chitinasiproducens palmae]SDV46350.1 3-hydroxyacyl-CoA dehydrogenase [Chitinasiproducens palmae]